MTSSVSPYGEARDCAGVIEGTVLLPLFNHGRFVERAIEAIAKAWTEGYELLLVDDASTDDGFAVAQRALARHGHIPTTVVRCPATGGLANVATVLALARGRFLVQADSDDMMLQDRLTTILQVFRDDPSCRLVTSNALLVTAEDVVVGLYDTRHPDATFDDPRLAAEREYDGRWLGATSAYHRDVVAAFGQIDTRLCSYGFDMLSPLRALLLGTHHYVARPLVAWRLHEANSHRLAGAYEKGTPAGQRYEAGVLMTLAQKLRDIEALRPGDEGLSAAARATFFAAFDRWSRLMTQPPGSAPVAARQTAIAVPPIATLAAGCTIDLRAGGHGAIVAACWAGFQAAEDWGCWTERSAVIVLRVVAPSASQLIVELQAARTGGRHRLELVNAGAVEIELGAHARASVALDVPACAAGALLALIVHSPDAARPIDYEQGSSDDRLIGVGIVTLALRTRGSRREACGRDLPHSTAFTLDTDSRTLR